jgi:hypothetical protein
MLGLLIIGTHKGEEPMNEQYRGFNLYGGSDPISETLLGHVTHWKPTGCIAHKRRNGVITELMRFEFPMNCDEENVAMCFGLEISRLLLDSSFRDFAIARYESEKRMIMQSRRR